MILLFVSLSFSAPIPPLFPSQLFPMCFHFCSLADDEDVSLSDQGISTVVKKTSLSRGISVMCELGEGQESKINLDEEEDDESLEKMFQGNKAF